MLELSESEAIRLYATQSESSDCAVVAVTIGAVPKHRNKVKQIRRNKADVQRARAVCKRYVLLNVSGVCRPSREDKYNAGKYPVLSLKLSGTGCSSWALHSPEKHAYRTVHQPESDFSITVTNEPCSAESSSGFLPSYVRLTTNVSSTRNGSR